MYHPLTITTFVLVALLAERLLLLLLVLLLLWRWGRLSPNGTTLPTTTAGYCEYR
jgi:hypothetical protein